MSYDALPVDQAKEKPASSFTQDMQKKVLRSLPFDDRRASKTRAKDLSPQSIHSRSKDRMVHPF